MRNFKSQTTVLAVFFIAIISVSAAGYFYLQTKKSKGESVNVGNYIKTIPDTKPKEGTSSADGTAGWETFNYESRKIALRYPPSWQIGRGGVGGCGPTLGPAAKPGSLVSGVFPSIALCTTNDNTDEFAKYSMNANATKVERGEIAGHRLIKLLFNPSNRDDSIYTILVETKQRDDPKSLNLIIYTYYNPKYYPLYGTESNFSEEKFIKTIDQVLSTLKFFDQKISAERAVELVRNQKEVKEWLTLFTATGKTSPKTGGRAMINFDHMNGNQYVIHVYEELSTHTATFNWYEVDSETGAVTRTLD